MERSPFGEENCFLFSSSMNTNPLSRLVQIKCLFDLSMMLKPQDLAIVV